MATVLNSGYSADYTMRYAEKNIFRAREDPEMTGEPVAMLETKIYIRSCSRNSVIDNLIIALQLQC